MVAIPQKHVWWAKIVLLIADGHGTAANCPAVGEPGYPFLAAARCKHRVYTVGKRARSWDRRQGTRFTATRREGDWIQVENGRLKGWINSQFLVPDKPR